MSVQAVFFVHQHLTPGIIANLCTECDISGGTVLVALLARLSASRIKMCGCFRLVDDCTNVSPGFVKEVVYFTKVVTKSTMCSHILDIEIFLLPITLTGNTKILSGLGPWPKINYHCDTCQIVSFCYSGIVQPRGMFCRTNFYLEERRYTKLGETDTQSHTYTY